MRVYPVAGGNRRAVLPEGQGVAFEAQHSKLVGAGVARPHLRGGDTPRQIRLIGVRLDLGEREGTGPLCLPDGREEFP